ncbi:hypothetical protein LTR66_007004 [Elasticomyces elasticus]|nr:hypothetical protein LTR66_007004 [Elasticomyces elasticus]
MAPKTDVEKYTEFQEEAIAKRDGGRRLTRMNKKAIQENWEALTAPEKAAWVTRYDEWTKKPTTATKPELHGLERRAKGEKKVEGDEVGEKIGKAGKRKRGATKGEKEKEKEGDEDDAKKKPAVEIVKKAEPRRKKAKIDQEGKNEEKETPAIPPSGSAEDSSPSEAARESEETESPPISPPGSAKKSPRPKHAGSKTKSGLKWTKVHTRTFVTSGHGWEGSKDTWYGGWPLGSGGYGSAAVWISLDENHRVTKRMAVKEVRARVFDWHQADKWVPYGGALSDSAVPIECHVLERLSKAKSPHVIEWFGYTMYRKRYTYRLYTEFCGFGDLWDLTGHAGGRLPEPFVWWVFESLVNAAIVMARGKTEGEVKDWKKVGEVVHRDMKPGNVFVGEPSKDRFRMYPTPKLGDWGNAMEVKSPDQDSENPQRYWDDCTTPGYVAPEMVQWLDPDTGHYSTGRGPLGSHTNVWCIGSLMMGLLSARNSIQPDFKNDDLVPNFPDCPAPVIRRGRKRAGKPRQQWETYSKELVALIMRCVVFDYNDRIGLDDLLTAITVTHRDKAAGMDTLDPATLTERQRKTHRHALSPPEDSYRVGLSSKELPEMEVYENVDYTDGLPAEE